MPVVFGTMDASLSDGGRYQDRWYRSLSLRTFLFEREDVRAVAAPSHKKCAPARILNHPVRPHLAEYQAIYLDR